MSTIPPGWYDDGHGTTRWWDGQRWTEHAAPQADASQGGASAVPGDASQADVSEHADAASDPQAAAAGDQGPGPQGGASAAPQVAPLHPAVVGSGVPAVDQPKKSRLWILWVALAAGVVLLIVLAAVLVPQLVRLVAGAAGGGGEEGAVAAVQQYDRAWAEGDCSMLEASTTENFREVQGLTDCAVFQENAQYLADSSDDYQVTVTDVETLQGGMVEVSTSERYLSVLDQYGDPLATPEPVEDLFTYVVVRSGDEWLIDAVR